LDSFCFLLFEEVTTEKSTKPPFFRETNTHYGVFTAAVVGLLLATFYDPVWTAEILTNALAAAALSAM